MISLTAVSDRRWAAQCPFPDEFDGGVDAGPGFRVVGVGADHELGVVESVEQVDHGLDIRGRVQFARLDSAAQLVSGSVLAPQTRSGSTLSAL